MLTHRHSCTHTSAVQVALHAHTHVPIRVLAPAQEQSRHADTDLRGAKPPAPPASIAATPLPPAPRVSQPHAWTAALHRAGWGAWRALGCGLSPLAQKHRVLGTGQGLPVRCGCKLQAGEPRACGWEPEQPGDTSMLGSGKPGAEQRELGLCAPGLEELAQLWVAQQVGTLGVHTPLCPRRRAGRYLGGRTLSFASPQVRGMTVHPAQRGWVLLGGMKQLPPARGSSLQLGRLCGAHRVGPSGGAGPAPGVPTAGASAGAVGQQGGNRLPLPAAGASWFRGVPASGRAAPPHEQSPTRPGSTGQHGCEGLGLSSQP